MGARFVRPYECSGLGERCDPDGRARRPRARRPVDRSHRRRARAADERARGTGRRRLLADPVDASRVPGCRCTTCRSARPGRTAEAGGRRDAPPGAGRRRRLGRAGIRRPGRSGTGGSPDDCRPRGRPIDGQEDACAESTDPDPSRGGRRARGGRLVSRSALFRDGQHNPAASSPKGSTPSAVNGSSPWQVLPRAPTARQQVAGATTSNGTLWILGGLHGSGSTAKVEGYDPVIANVD